MNSQVTITPEILKLIAQIDEFKGRWEALGAISRDRLTQLKKTATIESIASSTRIERSNQLCSGHGVGFRIMGTSTNQ